MDLEGRNRIYESMQDSHLADDSRIQQGRQFNHSSRSIQDSHLADDSRILQGRQFKNSSRSMQDIQVGREQQDYPNFQDLQLPSDEEELSPVLKKEDLEEFHRYKKKDLTAYYYIGRDQDEEKIEQTLKNAPGPLAISGVHGIGKSALIRHLTDTLRAEEDWIVVNISAADPDVPLYRFLSEEIYREADPKIRKMIEVISGIRVEKGCIQINAPGEKYRSIQYRMLINSMARILKEAGSNLLLVLDPLPEYKVEAKAKNTDTNINKNINTNTNKTTNTNINWNTNANINKNMDINKEEIREMIALSQGLSRSGYPVSLILSKSPSDKLSIRTYPLEMLNPWDVKEAYNQLFTDQVGLNEDDLLRMTRLTGGYPLAYRMLLDQIRENPQLDSAHLPSVESSYRTGLFRGVYYQLYQPLSRVEKVILTIMEESPEEDVPLTSICEKLGRPKSYLSVYRKRLLDAQIVRTEIRGTLRFTFPMFDEFLREYRILFQGK